MSTVVPRAVLATEIRESPDHDARQGASRAPQELREPAEARLHRMTLALSDPDFRVWAHAAKELSTMIVASLVIAERSLEILCAPPAIAPSNPRLHGLDLPTARYTIRGAILYSWQNALNDKNGDRVLREKLRDVFIAKLGGELINDPNFNPCESVAPALAHSIPNADMCHFENYLVSRPELSLCQIVCEGLYHSATVLQRYFMNERFSSRKSELTDGALSAASTRCRAEGVLRALLTILPPSHEFARHFYNPELDLEFLSGLADWNRRTRLSRTI